MSTPGAQERYLALAAKVDAKFAQVNQRYAGAMHCSAGCTDCCAGGLSVTLVEASVVAEALAHMPAAERRDVVTGALAGPRDRCAALDDSGRCRVYASRPLVCRSHGLPIRVSRDPGGEAPESVVACPHNFSRRPRLAEVDSDCILDQRTLSTVLGAVDMAFADEQNCPRGERIAISDLLAEPDRYFEMPADSEPEV